MSSAAPTEPCIVTVVTNPEKAPIVDGPSARGPQVEVLEDADLISPQPDAAVAASPAEEQLRSRGGWLGPVLLVGVAVLALLGTVEWVLGLVVRLPILGVPATLALIAVIAGGAGLVIREAWALRRLHQVGSVRDEWPKADGRELAALISQLGAEFGEPAAAERAKSLINDSGPQSARRLFSVEVLASSDARAAAAVAAAARQAFVIVAASPSAALDSLLLLLRAFCLLRLVATLYGYRPGALALRSLALAAGRDAGAVAVADALAEAAAQGIAHGATVAGGTLVTVGAGAAATGLGAVVGIPLAALGAGMALAGRVAGPAGSAVGGGATAAWRLYRFGIMVIVAIRPVPFSKLDLAEITSRIRADVLRLHRSAAAAAAQPSD